MRRTCKFSQEPGDIDNIGGVAGGKVIHFVLFAGLVLNDVQ